MYIYILTSRTNVDGCSSSAASSILPSSTGALTDAPGDAGTNTATRSKVNGLPSPKHAVGVIGGAVVCTYIGFLHRRAQWCWQHKACHSLYCQLGVNTAKAMYESHPKKRYSIISHREREKDTEYLEFQVEPCYINNYTVHKYYTSVNGRQRH
jgi:hypothetical protein